MSRLFSLLFTCLALGASLSSAKLSSKQIQSVFGTTKGLKAVTGTAPLSYDLTIIANTTHALVVMQTLDSGLPKAGASQVGWIAIGGGKAMKGSDDFILWPNSNGKWTISHRYAKDTITPTDSGPSTNGDFTLVPSLCTTSKAKVAQVAFLRKLKPSYSSASANKNWNMNSLNLVYSRATRNPGSSDAAAKILFHDVGYGKVALSKVKSLSARTNGFGSGKLIAGLSPRSDLAQSAPIATAATTSSKNHKAHAASAHHKLASSLSASSSSSSSSIAAAVTPSPVSAGSILSTTSNSLASAQAAVQQNAANATSSATSLILSRHFAFLAFAVVMFR